MAILDILRYPDPRLRTKALAIANVDDAVRQLAGAMFETMYSAPGIGLAASQVNVHRRLIVIDVSDLRQKPLCLINPELLETYGFVETQEGCLSVPEVFEPVTRAESIRVRAIDLTEKIIEIDANGLLAACIQHEIDHLDGKLFVDRLSSMKRSRIRKRFEKLQRNVG
ncbi:MAG: peptide deformylase [Gammaproteobacteria bacterium]